MTINQPSFLGARSGPARGQRVAVIGSGISGLSAAWLLDQNHDVTVFEAADYIGGHSHTVDVSLEGKTFPVDTGFIVYNPVNYPNLTALFDLLAVDTQATDMSFSVSKDQGGFEYSGGDGGGLLAQPSNLLKPRFWRMLRDLLRFYRNSQDYGADPALRQITLGELLAREGYSDTFYEDHLGPMGAAIWSSDSPSMKDYPAGAFMAFVNNHGLAQLRDRPQWRTVTGGSREYVAKICRQLKNPVRLHHTVVAVQQVETARSHNGLCQVELADGQIETFDQVVFACHSDQAAALIAGAADRQAALLSQMRYGANRVVLHWDENLMPKRKKAWASWNYLEGTPQHPRPGVSYWMNNLQHLPVSAPVLVTLNPPREINPDRVLAAFDYDHPIFDGPGRAAREELWSLQGDHNFWFCGAYLGDGFHEDGIQSGLAVAELLGKAPRPWFVAGQNARIGQPDNLTNAKVSV
ncbi:NAD(P)/FAD-dependent oxidoreductase [Rhodovibrionaceae bacterium A322]